MIFSSIKKETFSPSSQYTIIHTPKTSIMKFYSIAIALTLLLVPDEIFAKKESTKVTSSEDEEPATFSYQPHVIEEPNVTRYLVKYKSTSTEYKARLENAAIQAQAQSQGGKLRNSSPSIGIDIGFEAAADSGYLLTHGKFLPKENIEIMYLHSEKDKAKYEARDDVEYVEADHKVYLMSEETPYGINKVKALLVPDTNVSNRKVCIVDTGYDLTHPDLTSDLDVVTGYDGEFSAGPSPWSYDGHGHGTHVAGTIAAIEGNNEGVVGVNRNGNVKLHIVKVFGDNGSWAWGSSLIAAVEECVDAGANIVSMSLGGGGFSQTESNTYARVFNQDGVLLVAAAGNGGNTAYSYPASYDSVMSVAATDSDNNIASFSQRNDQVDIAAPGVGTLSTLPLHVAASGYSAWSGTSMATPHVSGVAALVWSAYPTKTASEIRQALEASAQDLGSAGRDNTFGHGLVRADLAATYLDSSFTLSPTVAPTLDPCTDNPVGWHDSDGPDYNCEWYSQGSNCDQYGDSYENDGKTANVACCACDGGTMNGPATSSPSESSTADTSAPTVSPSASPVAATDSPSALPSVSPTVSPSKLPTIGSPCVEGSFDKFLFRKSNRNRVITKTCQFVQKKKSKGQLGSLCDATDSTNAFKAARDVCQVTCGTCPSDCVELGSGKFFREKIGRRATHMRCETLADMPDVEIAEACAVESSPTRFAPAKSVCPVTCGKCQ